MKLTKAVTISVAAAAAALMLGAPAVHAASNPLAGLLGIFGPLTGSVTLVCDVDADRGTPDVEALLNGSRVKAPNAKRDGLHELARLTVPLTGDGIKGTLFHESLEGCTVPVTNGQLSLGTGGIGTLILDLNIGATVTDQGDLPCSALFGGQTSLTETFHVVSEPAQSRLGLVGEENYAPPVGGGMALVPVRGACVRE